MNHGFKLKYDQMRENVPDAQIDMQSGIERHENKAPDRKLCFILADSSRLRLNYAYLISEEFYPDKNMIVLAFTSHTVTLTGQNLDKLCDELEQNMPRIIACTDARYNLAAEPEAPIVNTIQIVNANE